MTLKILRANGTITRNGWTGPIVGVDPLGDNDLATYIEQDFSSGAFIGATVGLEPLVGYQSGDLIQINAQMDVTIVPDDPDTQGVLELFIASDPEGVNEMAAFTDGAHGSFGFRFTTSGLKNNQNLRLIDPYTLDDVVAALEAGAYLDINAITWQNGTIEPLYRLTYAEIRVGADSTVTHAPPLRRYPRSDGLGIGARRHYPPPESRRRVGGYY